MLDREFVLSTSLRPSQINDALKRRCELRDAPARPVAALFEGGSISSERFDLQLIGQRNHAKVTISGEIVGGESGSTVSVRVGISDPFGLIWSAGCIVGALVALLSIRSWGQAPAGIGVAMGAMGLFMLWRFMTLRALDDRASTAELALKDVLYAKAATDRSVDGGLGPLKS